MKSMPFLIEIEAAAEAECLGAINYLAGCVAWVREQR
jgi:hypothetical protein